MKKIISIIIAVALLSALAGYIGAKRSTDDIVQRYGSVNEGSLVGNVEYSQKAPAGTAAELREDNSAGAQPGIERKITKEISLTITVPSVEAAVSVIEELIKGTEGYIQSSGIWQENQSMRGRLTLRLPVEKCDEILQDLEKMGRVEKKNITSKDVTEEYYDAAARKTTLESQEKRLLELINQANTVSEMLQIENELARVRGQVESLQARLNVLDSLTDLAKVNIEIQAPRSIAVGGTLKEPLGLRIKAGFLKGWNGVVNIAESFIVLLAVLIPFAPVYLITGYIIYRVWKKLRGKAKP